MVALINMVLKFAMGLINTNTLPTSKPALTTNHLAFGLHPLAGPERTGAPVNEGGHGPHDVIGGAQGRKEAA